MHNNSINGFVRGIEYAGSAADAPGEELLNRCRRLLDA